MKRIFILILTFMLSFSVEASALSKIGSRGQEVINIQTRLKQWKYYNYTVDGVYGWRTAEAVKLFQKKHGLTPDGICGNATLAKIGLSTSSSSSS